MLELDGSYEEGGGQIIRTALALSTLTRIPFHAYNIRKGREVSGLKAQHVCAIKSLENLCNAKAENVKVGSSDIYFTPGKIESKTVSVDIGTAGSITLLLQALLMPCFFADGKVRLKITGGTDGKWAMPFDYFVNVYLPHIKRFCKSVDVDLVRRGYFPKGAGKVDIEIVPNFHVNDYSSFDDFVKYVSENVDPIELINLGELKEIRGISHASESLRNTAVAERQSFAARKGLSKVSANIKIENKYYDTLCPGSGIVLWADYGNARIGGDALGERSKMAEIVGKESADNLLEQMSYDVPVDSFLSDNLVPWLIFGGKINVGKITDHVKSNVWAVEKFVNRKYKIEDNFISLK
jgi:RNA 3'-phosphate cyclase